MPYGTYPRKTDRPPTYAPRRRTAPPWLRRARLIQVALVVLGMLLLWIVILAFRRHDTQELSPPDTPRTILVTSFDEAFRGKYERMIVDNRKMYARMHGYGLFLPNKTDYDLSDPPSPSSWAKIPALRHALATFPHSEYFFYLDQHALVMRPELSIEDHVLKPSRLSELTLIDQPVTPSSVIRTYKNVKPENIEAVFIRDHEGVGSGTFVLKRGEWAKYFLDAWFDPLYRSYNFQRAERHALEHLVQWHGTVLMKMALVPQRIMDSYTMAEGDNTEGMYKDGDFIANFHGCDRPGAGRDCEKEAEPLIEHLQSLKLDRLR